MRWAMVVMVWGLFAVGGAVGEEKAVVHAWAEKLSVKFWEGGDRVFVYEMKKPDAPVMHVQVADCQSKKFGAIRLMEGESLEQALGWFALGDGGEVGQWAMGETGARRMVGMGEVLEKMGEMEKAMGGDGKFQLGGFNWSLYLKEKSVSMAMGLEMSEQERRAPWLKEGLVGGAKEVKVGDGQVEFVLPDGGALLVRNDGVLLEQKAKGGRSMKLLSVEPMKEWSVTTYFGKFDLLKMKKEEIEGGRYYFMFLRQYAAAVLGNAVENKRTVEEMEKSRGEALEVMTEMYRPLAGTLIERDPELLGIARAMGGFFQQSWAALLKEKPEAGEVGSYADFVKMFRGKFWKKLEGKREEFEQKVGSKKPSLFSKEERGGFKGEEAKLAAWMEAVGDEAFTLGTLAELLDWAVEAELVKEAGREAGLE